jgi:hypothetical protein
MSQQIKQWGWLSFGRCVEMLGRGRKSSRKLGPNTQLVKVSDDEFRVEFHDNVIMQLTADGAIRLFSGGHRSVTTKSRLCALSPRPVHQRDFDWFVGPIPFAEGINVGNPQTARESIMCDVWDGKIPASVRADYDADHAHQTAR